MITLKKVFVFLLVVIFFASQNLPAYAEYVYVLAPQYLCELGIKFYERGRFTDALHELRKALILKPDDETAKRYINLIEERIKPAPVIAPAPVEEVPEKPLIEKTAPPAKEITPVEEALKKPTIVTPSKKPAVEKPVPLIEAPPVVEEVPEKPALVTAPEKPLVAEKAIAPVKEITPIPPDKTRLKAIQRLLDKLEKEKKKIVPVKKPKPVVKKLPERPPIEKAAPIVKALPEVEKVPIAVIPVKPAVAEKAAPPVKKIMLVEKVPKKEVSLKKGVMPEALILDESIKALKFPLEIEKDKGMIIRGKNIKRFLVTQPNALSAEKMNQDEILVTGKDIGYTYLHVWDDNGRWTTEWLVVFPKPEGPTYAEMVRWQEELGKDFRLRYYLDWISFETGRRITDLNRNFYAWSHHFELNGPTPYGDIDSAATFRRLIRNTDLTYFTLGLSDGSLPPFKGFNVRTFDFTPTFATNLAFPVTALRGAMFSSPAFNNKFNYITFWGREGGGRIGNLSPNLSKIQHSFLDGFNLTYLPTKRQNYEFTLVHGWGRDRQENLNPYAYDLSGAWNFNEWGLDYEIANNSEKFAQIFNTYYNWPKLKLSAQLRNIDKDYLSITGSTWNQGQLGGLFNLNYTPMEKFSMNSRLDIFQDRLFPASDNDDRWNEDFSWQAVYRIDPVTPLSLSYNLQNALGRISQYRYQSPGIGISRTFKSLRNLSVYTSYYHQENENFTSPSLDYINERVYSGLRFNLFADLYYYINKEFNWLEERFNANHSRPNALETGIDWPIQFGKSPLRASLRFTYRDEEDTISNLSFLSGQDYIEGYSEISYRPSSYTEIYGSTRVRNTWADNPNITKRIEASFNAGVRYLWDTGLRWETAGNIEGYVFKDYNYDGLRQKDEPPVEGVKLWLGKVKSQVTDLFGYYKFRNVKGRKAYVTLDTATLPSAFVLTVPVTQEAYITHHRSVKLDFGIASHTEISGFIFEDIDGNGEFTNVDKAVSGIVLSLEDGRKAISDNVGKYRFFNISPIEHAVTLDLNSIPVYYLPQVPLSKKITLFEGITYLYNIPLRRAEQ